MEDDVAALHRGVRALVTADVPFDEVDVVRDMPEVRPAAGREVVEDANLVAELEESRDEMRPDEA